MDYGVNDNDQDYCDASDDSKKSNCSYNYNDSNYCDAINHNVYHYSSDHSNDRNVNRYWKPSDLRTKI